LPPGHENFHEDSVVVTLWMSPGLSVRKIWTSCLVGVLSNQSLIPK